MINRRTLLGGVSIAALSIVAGCNTPAASIVANLPQYAQDIQSIAAALNVVSSAVSSVSGISASVVSTVKNAIGQISTIAGEIASAAASSTTPTTLIQNFGSLFNTVANALGGNAGGTLGTVIQDGLTLLPTILSVAGIALAPAGTGKSAAAARLELRSIAGG